MELPKKEREIKSKSPNILTIFGATKVGKTTKLTELEDCLIIDTERGAEKVKGLIHEVNNLNDLRDVAEELSKGKISYKYIALDTIDNIVSWIEKDVCNRRKIETIGDIPYGAGYDEVRMQTFKIINTFKSFAKLIIIGHRKRTIIGTDKLEVKIDSLNLTGKLKAMIMADSDAIGYAFREKDILKLSFKGDDSLETGSRCIHLINKIINFEWDKIYID